MTTTTLPSSALQITCPSWCDNHASEQPHEVDALSGVLHCRVVGRGSDWQVLVYAAHDSEGLSEPNVYGDSGPDFEVLSDLLRYTAALGAAASVAAAAGMRLCETQVDQ